MNQNAREVLSSLCHELAEHGLAVVVFDGALYTPLTESPAEMLERLALVQNAELLVYRPAPDAPPRFLGFVHANFGQGADCLLAISEHVRAEVPATLDIVSRLHS